MSRSIIDDLTRIADRAPSSPALSWHHCSWTYGDLRRATHAVRAALVERRLARGDRVALLLRNSPQYVAIFYGALAAGCVAVPLNVQERASVLARQISHTTAALVVADESHPEWPELARALSSSGVRTLTISVTDSAEALEQLLETFSTSGPGDAAPDVTDQTLAMVIYTSGTTGSPKGVTLSHGNLATNARSIAAYLDIVPTDRTMCVLPFHFSYGNSVLNSSLISGAEVLLEDNLAFPQRTLRRMAEQGVTGFAGVPSTFSILLNRCRLSDYDLRLRYLTQAGGAMPKLHIQQLQTLLPNVRLFVMYGQTEATARLTYLPPERLADKLGSVGIPVAGTEIEIRRDGRAVAPGEGGEIFARGPGIMQGYWQDAQASQSVLVGGWLRTGDLGHFDAEGFLYIDGRSVEMIKVGAFRVSPAEVEEVLAEHPAIVEAAAVGMPDDVLGQVVRALVVLRSGCRVDEREVKAHCLQRLAAYKVPKSVEFVESLPRTSSGKVQRFKLV